MSGKQGSWVDLQHGTEGPHYDPYSFTEIMVHLQDGRTVMLHSGLMEFMVYHDGRMERRFDDQYHILRSKFESIVGMTPERMEKVYHELKQRPIRFHPCGTKALRWVQGFPGEDLLVCYKCGEVVGYEFDKSAIE